jgi:hypothetical protein
MKNCVGCNQELSDLNSATLSNRDSDINKCIDCNSQTSQSLKVRLFALLKPDRPVSRKEYQTLFAITVSLTLAMLVITISAFGLIWIFSSAFGGSISTADMIGVMITALSPALLIFIAFGVATSLGIIKRFITGFTSLKENSANIVTVLAMALLTITGFIFIFALPLGLAVSIRAIRRFRAESAT